MYMYIWRLEVNRSTCMYMYIWRLEVNRSTCMYMYVWRLEVNRLTCMSMYVGGQMTALRVIPQSPSTCPLRQGLLLAGSPRSRLTWLFPELLLPAHTPGLLNFFCFALYYFLGKKNHICLTCSRRSFLASGVQRKVVIQVLIQNGEKILGTFPDVLWGQLSVSIDASVVLGLHSALQSLCCGDGTSGGCPGRAPVVPLTRSSPLPPRCVYTELLCLGKHLLRFSRS